jgi:hypothetical protein
MQDIFLINSPYAVPIGSSQLPNMKDFLLVNRTHTFIMDIPEVQEAAVRFIETGKFIKK